MEMKESFEEAIEEIKRLLGECQRRQTHLDDANKTLDTFVFDYMHNNHMWDNVEDVCEVLNCLPNCFLKFRLYGRYEQLKNAQMKPENTPIGDKASKIDEKAKRQIYSLVDMRLRSREEVKKAEGNLKDFVSNFFQNNQLWNSREAVAKVICILPECDLRSELTSRYHELNDLEATQGETPTMESML